MGGTPMLRGEGRRKVRLKMRIKSEPRRGEGTQAERRLLLRRGAELGGVLG